MTTMNEIERLALKHRTDRDELGDAVDLMEREVSALREKHLRKIRPVLKKTAASARELSDAVEGAPELFAKPKSRTIHGFKMGFAKQRGKVSFTDAGKVVSLIRKHLAGRFSDLVKVTEAPDKNALANLTVADLKKIGCTVTEDDDVAFVRPVENDSEKLVKALLDAAEKVAA